MPLTSPLSHDLTSPLARGVGEGGFSVPSLNNYSVSNPIYIAHRGGSLMYPEETTEGYAASFAAGNRILEMDVQLLSDGGLAVMHDGTVDRTTTGTGNVVSFTTAQWQALAIDADTWFGSTFGNALVPPLFPDILTTYKGRAIVVPEAKATGDGPNVVAALQTAGIPSHQALVTAFTLSDLTGAVAAGYPSMVLTSTGTGAEISAAQAAGVTWVGVDSTVADSVFTAWVTAGFKVTAWVVNRRIRRDQLLALGVMGFFTDDPRYLAATTPFSATDNFAAQTWQPGMQSSAEGNTSAAKRGRFTAPDKWELPPDGANEVSVLQGWACPMKGQITPTSLTIDFKVTFLSANAGDATRWAGVFVGKNDAAFLDGLAPTSADNGYTFLVRKSGALQIFERTTASNFQAANVATVAIADGEEVAYRAVFTPTTVSLYRLDGSGAIAYTATYAVSDTSRRGGYLHLVRNGLSVDFRDITIS